ncbi:hypothetical protein GCM10011507_27830 [Edaphobacter acidisoli]|uniref:Uncharacterized protein n=1 Tax=Edaphobacter acidisoli TaxID=2040573 RepID=A0A916W8A4_9BACT|nr:hypothetical protein [Edaphobacter acidisoli]GGA74885.1 hypothetical protein GCM10011507_27830 [Edaphobacter acidisoli]
MSSKYTSRTARRLIKLASLGLAGLLAGLLAGCSETPPHTIVNTSYANADTALNFDGSQLPPNLDSVRIPPLKNAPSARRLEEDNLQPTQPASTPHLYGS